MRHKAEIVKIGIDELLNKSGYFSICDLNKLAETLGVNAKLSKDYIYLNQLHCVNYSDMSDELLSDIPNMIMNCLSSSFDSGVMAKALIAVTAGEINGLPSSEDDIPTRTQIRIK